MTRRKRPGEIRPPAANASKSLMIANPSLSHLCQHPERQGRAGRSAPQAQAGRVSHRLKAAGVALLLLVLMTAGGPAAALDLNYDLATTSVLRITLPISQALTVTVSESIAKVTAADPAIADAQLITDRSLYLAGKGLGITTVNLYSAEGKPVGLLAVEVGADTADIARSIRAAVPKSAVKVSTVNGRIRLGGTVPDDYSMQKVLEIVQQYGTAPVINIMTLTGGQQVNLEVRILEAQRDAARQLGVEWGGSIGKVSASVGGGSSDPAAAAASFSSFAANVLSGLSGVSLNVTINALEKRGLVRTLAEPNLTTLSGVKASFLAGGQVPIRTNDNNGNATLTYRDFGVRLIFTPMVLDGGRIQIHLTPEVSGLNGYTSSGDPIFTARNLDATVELRDGQSFSVAGLLQNETKLNQNQLPWAGNVPVLGALFKSSSYQKNETELVVIVTPRLVQPDTPGQAVASPLDNTLPANDLDFFVHGRLEVTPKMVRDFQSGTGVTGPYGYIINLGPGDGG
jgi:pilus assembly protein CpaC